MKNSDDNLPLINTIPGWPGYTQATQARPLAVVITSKPGVFTVLVYQPGRG